MNTELCGISSSMLGAGRETTDSTIDYAAGIILKYKVGDFVKRGDALATMYASNESLFVPAADKFIESITIGATKPVLEPLIFARVEKEHVERF